MTITGYTAAASDRWAANPTNPLTGPFTPNTNAAFIGLNHDLSGVGWQSSNTSSWQDLSVTLLSPMHFAAAKHVTFGYTNTTYTFQNTDGTLVSRTIGNTLNSSDVGGVSADSRVIRLDAPFASTDKVKVYRLLDTGAYSNLAGKNAILYGHANSAGANYQRRLGLGVVSLTSNNLIYTAQNSSLTNYVTILVSGDSGSPSFVVYNGELHLLGTHYANGGGYSQDNNFSYNTIYVNTNAFLATDGFALRWTIDTTNARTWTGATDGTFGSADNWVSLNQPSEFTSAAFDGATTSNRSITLGSAATVRGMLFKSASGTNPFTLSGSTLTLLESGIRNEDTDTLTINNPITLGGSQNWEAQNGPITLGGNIATAGFLVVMSGAQPITLAGNLTGTGSVAWDNPGTFTPASGQLGFTTGKLFVRRGVVNLTTANAYSGGTVVTGGTLLANNSSGSATGSGSLTLSNDARLGGNGTVTGAVTLQNTSGLLANLTTAPGSHDKLDITGALALGSTGTLTITATAGATTGTYTIVTATGGITGGLPTLTLPSGWSATAQISGNNLNLVVTSLSPTAPVIASSQATAATINTSFSYPITATQNPTGFAFVGGTLPPGLTLNTTTGVISGTPTSLGSYNPSFTATNAIGTSSTAIVTIAINSAPTLLTGSVIGTAGSYNNGSATVDKIFDGNFTTFFDAPTANGNWAGLDFGAGNEKILTEVRYAPRSTLESRILNAIIQGSSSADFTTGVVNLYTITATPTAGVLTAQSISNSTSFRYARILLANGSYGNVAELQFYGHSLPVLPSAPSTLSATATSSSQISLTWTDNATNETGFKLERSSDGTTGWTQIATPVANATTAADTGLATGTTSYYRLRATNAYGDSAYSNTASTATWSAAQSWRQTWFGDIANSGNSTDSADPDGDGLTNAQEYLAASDPLLPNAPGSAPATTLPARLVTLVPAADATAEASNPTVNSFTGDLLVRSESAIREAFLRYDLTALSGTVERAQLVFWPTAADSQTPTFTIEQVVDAGDAWTESALTWNNKPASLPATAVSFTGPLASGVPRVLDVTAMVTDTLANDVAKQLGLRLYATGSMPTQASSFGSKENSGTYRYPYLHITLRASASTPLKLMHVGDSITRGGTGGIGSNTFSNAGVRYYLHNLLLSQGLDFRAVGPRTDGTIATFRLGTDGSANSSLADRPLLFPANAGYSGQTIEYIRDNIGAWIGTYTPDVITLMIGTNNIGYTTTPVAATPTEINNWKSRYSTLLDNILAASSTVKVAMTTIPPAGGINIACNSTRIDPFNAQVIQALFAQYSATNPGRFFFVNSNAALSTADIGADGVHPSSLGHQKLARAWHAGIMAALGRTEETRFVNEFAGADAPLRGGTLAATALGTVTTPLLPTWTNTLLRAKADPAADNRAKPLLKFDLAGLPTHINTATLGLAYHGATPTGDLPVATTLLHLYGIKDGADIWTKAAVTWNSAPGHDSTNNGVLPSNVVYLASTTIPTGTRTGDLVTFSSTALADFLTTQVGSDDLASFVVVASGRQSTEVLLHASNLTDYQPPFLLITETPVTALATFRTTYGLAANGSQDTATPAADGVPNLLKYAFNMLGTGTGQASTLATPNAAVLAPSGSAGLPFASIGTGTAADKLQLTFIRRKASASPVPGITYSVEFTDDFATWAVNPSATESTTSLDATYERVTTTDSVAAPTRRFARIKVATP